MDYLVMKIPLIAMILHKKEPPEWIHMSEIVMNGSVICDVIEIWRVRRKVESCREEKCIAAVVEGGNECILILGCCGYCDITLLPALFLYPVLSLP